MNEEQLQKQIAELKQVVKDEQKLCQQTEHDLNSVQKEVARAAATATALAQDSQRKTPKIDVLDKFNGMQGTKVEVYVSQAGLHMISNQHIFPNDCRKVIFLVLYLTGPASTWAQPFTQKLFNAVEDIM